MGQKITERIGVKITENDPEYHGLAAMVTSEDKMKYILPNMVKRGVKVMFKKKPTSRYEEE